MTPDEFNRIVGADAVEAPAGGDEPAAVTITGAALRIEDAGPGKVFFVFCPQDYAANCFNGSFADVTDRAIVGLLLARGTELCVLRRENYERHRDWLAPYRRHLVVVDDAIVALQRFARAVRERHPLPVVGITGSAGKTTTKELTAHLLGAGGARVLYSPGNQNNGIGLPFTVQRLLAAGPHAAAVLEMGMSTRDDEIARLCRIAPPDVAVVLNVLPVHMEHLLTLDGVERAKAQIVEHMAAGGIAVLNADDPRTARMRDLAGRVMRFGLDPGADVRADAIRHARDGARFTLHHGGRAVEVAARLHGEHNVMNMLAAAAACLALDAGIGLETIAARLATFAAPAQRGRELALAKGATLVDDSYNSNPHSLRLAARAARGLAGPDGRLLVVAGGMHELGPDARALHVAAGAALAGEGVDLLLAVGLHADALVEGFCGACERRGEAHADLDGVRAALDASLRAGDIVLVKGSRAGRLERLVQALCEQT